MGMKIIRLADAAFVGDDGQEVHGMYVYLVPTGTGGEPERVFLSEKKMCDISYTPQVGDVVFVFRGRGGSFVPASLSALFSPGRVFPSLSPAPPYSGVL